MKLVAFGRSHGSLKLEKTPKQAGATPKLEKPPMQRGASHASFREAYRKTFRSRQASTVTVKTLQDHLAMANFREMPGRDLGNTVQLIITSCLLAACPLARAFRMLGLAQAAEEMGMSVPPATTVVIASVLVVLTLSAVIGLRYGWNELGVKCERWEVLKWMRPGACSGFCSLCFLTGAQSISPVLASVTLQTAPLITILLQMVFRAKLPDTVSLFGAVLVCVCAIQFTSMQVGSEGDASGETAFSFVGICLVLLSVVLSAASLIMIEIAAGGEENTGRNPYAASLNCVLLSDLFKIPFMAIWAAVMERDEIGQLLAGSGTIVPFLLGACLSMALMVLVCNSTAVLCGSFWMTMACSLEVMVVYIARAVLFGDRIVLPEALSLLALLIAVLTINHAVQRNNKELVELLEQTDASEEHTSITGELTGNKSKATATHILGPAPVQLSAAALNDLGPDVALEEAWAVCGDLGVASFKKEIEHVRTSNELLQDQVPQFRLKSAIVRSTEHTQAGQADTENEIFYV